MKAKIIVLYLVFVLIMNLLCACDNSSVSDKSDLEQDFILVYKGVEIVPGAEMAPVKEALGEPTSYYESISCAFEGMDKIYTYGSIQITTYTEKDVDYIYTIVLLDDGIATPEGIYIGSDVLNVISAYGEMELEQNVVIYTQGNTSITLGFRDGVVVSITYTEII